MRLELVQDLIARWPAAELTHVELLRTAGVNAVLTPDAPAPFVEACRSAGIAVLPPDAISVLDQEAYTSSGNEKPCALKEGLWPGVTRDPNVDGRGDETASASREPWVDANGFWVMWQRTMFPGRPALLAYEADLGDRLAPYDSLELALIDARVSGGNYLLELEPRFRKALLAGDSKAMDAWKSLGRTASWLRENRAFFGAPVLPTVTLLVEAGHETPEIANLAYRRIVSPALARAADPPAPNPKRYLEIVAVNLEEPAASVRSRILAHAEAGAIVVVASDPQKQWWRTPGLKSVKSDEDREIFSLGKGQVVAYREPIVDPSEFALDLIDLVSHRRRPVRIWNALAVIAFVTACPAGTPVPGSTLLHLVNYGTATDSDFPARVQGHFTRATLFRPDAQPLELKPARRGSGTEVVIPELHRLGVVVFG
jgi:hypothetical protein